jgi:hypothetical protein
MNGELVMNLPSNILAVALLAVIPLASPAAAAPIGAPLSLQAAAGSPIQTVQWRGDHRGWGGRGWSGGPGLAAGAIIGGAIAASRPRTGYDYSPGYYSNGYAPEPGYSEPGYSDYGYAPDQDAAYCVQRFRSYDPASGTYLGYDGYRHPCP